MAKTRKKRPPSELGRRFSDTIDARKRRDGYGPAKLARDLGIDNLQTVNNWKHRGVPAEHAERVAMHLGGRNPQWFWKIDADEWPMSAAERAAIEKRDELPPELAELVAKLVAALKKVPRS